MKRLIKTGLAIAILACAPHPVANGQAPVENVDPERHGNLARAQRLSHEAFEAITAAQDANEFDLGGHAARAKELLRQANEEIKLAALAANKHGR
jgi:hypothetical protein